MKTALGLALFGALFVVSQASCPVVAYHSCIKEEKPKKCKAVEVCEKEYKEECGDDECEFPYKCAYAKKEECKKFAVLKEKCEEKKVCKKVKKACGDGYCYLGQDCVKETKCYIKKYGRKLLDAYAHSEAHAHAGGYGRYPYYKRKEDEKDDDDKKEKKKAKLVCEDEYECVAKEECKEVTVKKCVKKELRAGIDYCEGGHHFYWYHIHEHEKCGDEYCGYGYDCAEVIIQKCETECGDEKCGYGYECVVEEDDCKEYALLETICKDVYKPTCVPLPPYVLLTYKPPCKTVYKCEEEESVCGEEYCPDGYVCAIDYKKTCGYGYYPAYGYPVVSKPEKEEEGKDDKKYVYYIKAKKKEEDHKEDDKDDHKDHRDDDKDDKEHNGGSAESYSSSYAGKDGTETYTETHSTGSGKAGAHGKAKTDGARSGSYSDAEDGETHTRTHAHSDGDKYAYGDAYSTSSSD